MIRYTNYNKQELVDKINSISISLNEAGQVITKYRDRVVSISNVSKRYEIFDIKKYLLDKLDLIEKNFNIIDCLEISEETGVPVVFDTHHYACYNQLHPEDQIESPRNLVPLILETWKRRGIKPKFHISEQGTGRCGHHSDYIDTIPGYLLEIPARFGVKIDIMVEAKMKEQALFRLQRKYYRELGLPFMTKFTNCQEIK